MPKKEFALEPGGPKRVTLTWKGLWKNIVVALDDRELGVIPNQKALKAGQEFPLGDGTTLKVQLVTGMAAELQVTRDGAPLPGSGSDPEERLKAAYSMIFFVAGLNAVLGIVAGVFEVEFLARLGLGIESLVVALLYAGLGFLVMKFRSPIALGFAVGLFALDGIASVVMMAGAGGSPPIGGIVARVFLIIPMVRGFAAIKELKKRPTPSMGIPEGAPSAGEPWEPPRQG